jgi:S-DNA-T family DNA segregation ATPase FtsK/SpoIIIE
MRPRLRTLINGTGEETVEECMGLLSELYEETTIRGQALREHDERFVTRALAEKDERLRPRIMVIDECQNLFISEHGEAAIKTAAKVMSTCRKYAITLMLLTPEPSQDACPRKLISITSNKACFAIGDQIGNDAVLGTGSYKAGISAVGLVPKTDEGSGDVGTAMTRGFMSKPGLLRCFYIMQEDMHRVTKRAMQLLQQHGVRVATVEKQPERDLLEDIDEVLDRDPVPAAQVADALKARFPRWAPYQRLTGKRLVGILERDYQLRVPSTGNLYRIDPVRMRERLAQLATADLDDEDE